MAKLENEKLKKVNGGVWQNTLDTKKVVYSETNDALLPNVSVTNTARVDLPACGKYKTVLGEEYIFAGNTNKYTDPNSAVLPITKTARPTSVNELEDTVTSIFVK